MITAIDSSVILDVLTEDPKYADASEACLRQASAEGKLILCECVLAEICPAVHSESVVSELLQDWQLEFVPSTRESAIMAGRHFGLYIRRGGTAKRIVADFLIGAHASVLADRLLARDRGYLRDYFKDLDVWSPGDSSR
ncbi:MAG: type II toxin-antitoxin system VapC family toxin [Kiritimatiellae bacterium]|nr:type II toxin-antitoxin system VapC family toxin [Kiritimatiellia bacterium]